MNNEAFVSNPALLPDNTQTEPNADPNVYVASVIMVTWAQLQPTNGSSVNTSAIESGLSAIAAYNTAHPGHTMVGKLRVFAGINSPAWALVIDGGPVTATINGTTGSLAKFWTVDYATAWTNLQNQLAAIYDKDPRIGEVAVSGCSSRTAEPFIFTVDPAVISVAQAAGYTDAQYQTCLNTMATQYAAWVNTPLDYSFNPFNHIDSGTAVTDTAYPIQVMNAWRSTLGTARGVLANHGLSLPSPPAPCRSTPSSPSSAHPLNSRPTAPPSTGRRPSPTASPSIPPRSKSGPPPRAAATPSSPSPNSSSGPPKSNFRPATNVPEA
jgi:hypothetical protein